MEQVTITFGEKRKISILVKSLATQPFEITNASYLLKCGDSIESSGNCEVVERHPTEMVVSALINPMRKCANYTLEYHYDITPERLIYAVRVRT